jgi:hypothetical protein
MLELTQKVKEVVNPEATIVYKVARCKLTPR